VIVAASYVVIRCKNAVHLIKIQIILFTLAVITLDHSFYIKAVIHTCKIGVLVHENMLTRHFYTR